MCLAISEFGSSWRRRLTMLGALSLGVAGCTASDRPETPAGAGSFDSDVAFLRQHTEVLMLTDGSGAQVVVSPAYQGRVMTSTTGSGDRPSFGWIGRAAIAAGTRQPHMNVFGGEDRFWLGPEGGQYALYFRRGDPFDLDHWEVPEQIDWGGWEVTGQSATAVRFRKRMTIVNYAGTTLEIDVERTVRLLNGPEVATHLGQAPSSAVRTVAFESSNTIANAGTAS